MSAVDEIAPYPSRLEDVTAVGLARHMTAEAHQGACRSGALMRAVIAAQDGGGDVELAQTVYVLNMAAATAGHGVGRLLRELIEHAPYAADEVARELWTQWDDAPLSGWTWQALVDDGVAPVAVDALGEEPAGGGL